MPIENYRAQMEVHSIGAFLFLRSALHALLDNEAQSVQNRSYTSRGSIVLVSSVASEGAFIGIGNYIAAKFAVKGLVQTAGEFYERDNLFRYINHLIQQLKMPGRVSVSMLLRRHMFQVA